MIKLGQKPPAPAVLSRPKITKALDFLRKQFVKNGTIASDDFSKKSYWGQVKRELSDYQHGKCCFCERGRDSNGEADVEHFRPKNAKNDEPAPGHQGYWWLAYDWGNLFFVCKECNSKFKGNKFPLVGGNEAGRVHNEGNNLSAENHVFFNFVNEDPEDFIAYDWIHSVPLPIPGPVDGELRAKETIDLLGLAKRPNLAEGRSIKLTNMQLNASLIHYYRTAEGKDDRLSDCIEQLKLHTNARSNYAGFARYFYKSQCLGEYIKNE